MALQDGLGDGQPQAGAHLAGIAAAAVVPVKDIGQVLLGDAGAVVLHLHQHLAALARGAAQLERPVLADMVHGVAQQVVKHPLHHGRVGVYRAGLFRLQLQGIAVLRAHRLVAGGHFLAQLGHIKADGLRLFRAAAHLGQLHDTVHKAGQPVGLVHNNVQLLGALSGVAAGQIAHRLRITLDEGEGGAQVMAHIRQQIFLHLGGLVHLARHMVKVAGQLVQLVAALGGLQPHLIVALGHLARGAGQLGDGPGKPAAEQPGRQHAQHQQNHRHQRHKVAQNHAGLVHLGQAGGQDDRVLPIARQAAYHHLAAGSVRALHDLIDLALLGHLGPQRDHRIGILLGRGAAESAVTVMQQAGVQMLDVGNAAQRVVGNVHTAALQVQLAGNDVLVHAVPKVLVPHQGPVIAGADGFLGRVDAACQRLHLAAEHLINMVVVQRLQKTRGERPHHQQGDDAHQAQEQHQLAADAPPQLLPFHRRHFTAPGSNLYPTPHTVTM